ncbi:uncharacterized protein DMAD_01154 [Drosophila madeirensis]|uniref:Uncharacterized protein n=1 Tax=Drosophila madeirensis TaxID=30013 RepID=A0AAU9G0D8_DROMD
MKSIHKMLDFYFRFWPSWSNKEKAIAFLFAAGLYALLGLLVFGNRIDWQQIFSYILLGNNAFPNSEN